MAVDDAHVFPGFLTPVLTQLFSHASVEVRGENTPKESSPQPGIKLTTTRLSVRQAHHEPPMWGELNRKSRNNSFIHLKKFIFLSSGP